MESKLKAGDFIKSTLDDEIGLITKVCSAHAEVLLRDSPRRSLQSVRIAWLESYTFVIELSEFEKIIYGF